MKKYLKSSLNIFCKKTFLESVFSTLFFIFIFILLYFAATIRLKDVLINQSLHQQELAVKSGANSMEIFLKSVKNSLLLLSRNPSVIDKDNDIEKVLKNFALDWVDTPVRAATRFDKNGDVVALGRNTVIFDQTLSVKNISDRDYFQWAQTASERDTFLGKPLIPRTVSPDIQYVFPYVTPIFKDGQFDGILALTISLPQLTTNYLEPLFYSEDVRIYLMHQDGTIMSSLATEKNRLVGFNYLDYLNQNPYHGSDKAIYEFAQALKSENEGLLNLVLYDLSIQKHTRFLIAYHSIVYDNVHWTLAVAVPENRVCSIFTPLENNGILVVLLYIIVITSISFIGYFIHKINKVMLSSDNK